VWTSNDRFGFIRAWATGLLIVAIGLAADCAYDHFHERDLFAGNVPDFSFIISTNFFWPKEAKCVSAPARAWVAPTDQTYWNRRPPDLADLVKVWILRRLGNFGGQWFDHAVAFLFSKPVLVLTFDDSVPQSKFSFLRRALFDYSFEYQILGCGSKSLGESTVSLAGAPTLLPIAASQFHGKITGLQPLRNGVWNSLFPGADALEFIFGPSSLDIFARSEKKGMTLHCEASQESCAVQEIDLGQIKTLDTPPKWTWIAHQGISPVYARLSWRKLQALEKAAQYCEEFKSMESPLCFMLNANLVQGVRELNIRRRTNLGLAADDPLPF